MQPALCCFLMLWRRVRATNSMICNTTENCQPHRLTREKRFSGGTSTGPQVPPLPVSANRFSCTCFCAEKFMCHGWQSYASDHLTYMQCHSDSSLHKWLMDDSLFNDAPDTTLYKYGGGIKTKLRAINLVCSVNCRPALLQRCAWNEMNRPAKLRVCIWHQVEAA
jgi:hypothetical protein